MSPRNLVTGAFPALQNPFPTWLKSFTAGVWRMAQQLDKSERPCAFPRRSRQSDQPQQNNKANLPTGAVEVFIEELEVLGAAGELPMPVFGEQEYPEDVRLKYRFLDLRRERLHRNIVTRSKVISSIRRRMSDLGFMEYQTPMLTASSPEGARAFLVPSRLHAGKFYALPQSPQL